MNICTVTERFHPVGKRRCTGRAVAEDPDLIESFESSDLLGRVQSIHYGQLNVHED